MDREEVRIIQKNLRRNRNLKVSCGLALLCFAVYVIGFGTTSLPERTAIVVAVLFMLLGLVGLYFILHGVLRYDSQRNYILKHVIRERDAVAWVYYESIQHFPFGVRFLQIDILHIRLINREHISIMMREPELLYLIQMLRKQIPSATFGYSVYKEQLYNINPDLLINMKEHEK